MPVAFLLEPFCQGSWFRAAQRRKPRVELTQGLLSHLPSLRTAHRPCSWLSVRVICWSERTCKMHCAAGARLDHGENQRIEAPVSRTITHLPPRTRTAAPE